jgi:hypothetical protein
MLRVILWVTMATLAASGLCAQTTPLERLHNELSHVKALPRQKIGASDIEGIQGALSQWIESRLPADKGLLHVDMPRLAALMTAELKEAHLTVEGAPNPPEDAFEGPGFDYVAVTFRQLPELPDTLLVNAGVSIPCGMDEAIYLYLFDANSRTRAFADHPVGTTLADLQISQPDAQGRRLLLTHHLSTQCWSTWMNMAYSVYRFGALPAIPEKLLSERQGFWIGDTEPLFDLTPDELLVEFLGLSTDVDVHHRTRVRRFEFRDGVRRIDPIALQPQDFVEEWLLRPWAEMESRSLPATKPSHDQLHADFVLGEYSSVVPCLARPGRWLIDLAITDIGGKKLAAPLETYFLVRELGNYKYQMESAGDQEPEGCPGNGGISNAHPWATAAGIRDVH